MSRPLKVLFAASEAYPLVKTGGLGDVAHSLTNALAGIGVDVRLLLPGYPEVLDALTGAHTIDHVVIPPFGRLRLVRGRHDAFDAPLVVVESATLFGRGGNPYVDEDGAAWPDNAARFCAFAHVCALLGRGVVGDGWRADIVHGNDWQVAMASPYLHGVPDAPRSVFPIHNVSYDCLFDHGDFSAFHLPAAWWSVDGGEYHHRFSMLKSGIVYSDRVTTVSPRYAEEIRTPAYGYGYAGILAAHRGKLSGILNGVDTHLWNPATDPYLERRYRPDEDVLEAKRVNRVALLEGVGADEAFRESGAPLVGFVGRMVAQKGIDLLLDAIPLVLAGTAARFVIIGTGERAFEQRARALTRIHPGAVACWIGYSERLAHLLEAGSDLYAMPSRFEPCGLNQMYSMLYGTPPVARRTGGLADTVVDAAAASPGVDATGFLFDEESAEALAAALVRAIEVVGRPAARQRMIEAGMARDFGWKTSARRYLALYRECAAPRVAVQAAGKESTHG